MAFGTLSTQAEQPGLKKYLNPTYIAIGAALAILGGMAVRIVAGIVTPKSK